MLIHYFKTVARNLWRSKLFSLVNVLGLSIGMAACLLILHYVNFEKSYDKFYKDSRRIYRLRYDRSSEEGQIVQFASCCPPAADAIRGAYPEVEEIARIFRYRGVVSLRNRDINFTEDRMYFAEPGFFNIFDFKFSQGDAADGIREPNSAFISRSTARKYFGVEVPLGQTLSVDGRTDYKIAGIFEDIPQNSHLKFDILLSYRNLIPLFGPEVIESWGETGFFTYLKLKAGADFKAFEKKMPGLVDARCGELMRAYKVLIELKMQPLTDIHLSSHYMQEYEINGSRQSADILTTAAVFIIIMSWINFINLSTARSLTRAKEVGLRKVVGASRFRLILQFFFETGVINLMAASLALLLVLVFLPSFRQISGIALGSNAWKAPWFWSVFSFIFLAGIFLSGFYPVMALSAFKPASVLKGKLGSPPRGLSLRKVLVVFQFVIALALVTATLTAHKQIVFMKNRDLGFDMNQVLVVNSPRVRDEAFGTTLATFKKELLRQADVRKLCLTSDVPGRQVQGDAGGIRRAGEDAGKGKNYMILGIDYDYLDVFGLKVRHGRNFSKEFPADKNALLLNETAAKWMGFNSSREAVGQQVDFWGEFYTIIGVLADFHQQSLKEAFEPHIYRLMPNGRPDRGAIALKISPRNVEEIVRFVERLYKQMFPGNPYEYFFLDDYFNQQYRGDELFGRVMGLFSFLAVLVTGLGIFGMSSHMAVQRSKEIGIRKVLGATTSSILALFMREFLALLSAAVLVAWPLSFLGIQEWLKSFAYRRPISGMLFLAPLAVVSVITMLTISSNVIKASLADPVDSIKYE